MAKANRVHSTPPTNTPIHTHRRHFLAVAAGASVVSVGALTAAAMPAIALGAEPAPDPIYAVIDLHRAACEAHREAVRTNSLSKKSA
jgi:hypothetical protein